MAIKKQAKAESIQAHYERLVAQGSIKNDTAQREVLTALAALQAQLARPRRGLFTKSAKPVRGLYIWGNVGRGKSMLMDLFFEHVPFKDENSSENHFLTREVREDGARRTGVYNKVHEDSSTAATSKFSVKNDLRAGFKRRVHFHAFMQEVYTRIHRLRQEKQTDPVAVLTGQLANETTLLCFDELQANDVADATLLYRLFSGLFDAGVVIVSTSNHPPATLYTGGVQRERFAKFIALIEKRMQVMGLSSPEDYRQMQMKALQKVYFYPLGPGADVFIDNILKRLGAANARQDTLAVQGRMTPFTLYSDNIGRFTFHQLCETALGPADYLALARRLDTVIVTDIPKLTADKRNEAKRFVTLIDALYENKIKLIATAAAAAEQLYPEGDGSFDFKRTASRLVEMQSEKWIKNS